LTEEDVRILYKEMGQAGPPQKLVGKWQAHNKAKKALLTKRQLAIDELAAFGPGAVSILLRTKSEILRSAGLHDVFVEAVVKMGKLAVPVVVDELSGAEVEPRIHAATALGRIGDAAAVEHLIRSLSDPDKRVVRAAVWSLGLLRGTAATEPLLEMWHKEQVVSRTSIASALGQIGDKCAAKPIRVALEEYVSLARQTGSWDKNSWAMRVYASALGQIGDQQAIPLLKKMLDAPAQKTKTLTPIYSVAEAAARALRSLGLEVIGDVEKGGYKLVETALNTRVKGDIKQEKI
jgi:HEAT repeat protein